MSLSGAKTKLINKWHVLRSLSFVAVVALVVLVPSNDEGFTNHRGRRRFVTIAVATAVSDPEPATDECELGPEGTCITNIDPSVDISAVITEDDLVLYGMKIVTKDDDGMTLIDTGFGVGQQSIGEQKEKIRKRLIEIHKYMNDRVLKASADDVLSSVASECQLRNELCSFWAVIGECEANPAYMKIQCAPACFTCEHLSFDTRCPVPENLTLTDVFVTGGLNQMFDRIVTDPYYQEQYIIEVLSRPSNDTAKSQRKKDTPWVVTVDNFLTDEECETLIRLGGDLGYQQSLDVGARKFDGTFDAVQSAGRTSTNAWCQDACFDHPMTKNVLSKIENLTGVPDDNSEYLQLLKYEVKQFYQQHHDYIDFHQKRAQGVRILTVFLYLNDVEKGGGTNFPKLSLTVQPKRGRALIWPSVLDEDPNVKDPSTDHQALPVEEGVKYGANAWLHLRDFKTPHLKSCI